MLNGSLQNGNKPVVPFGLVDIRSVLLSSPYKGLMLTDQVRVLHMGKDFGVFEACNHSVFSSIKDNVYLHGGNLTRTVKASIDEINPQRSWITLSRFQPLATPWHERREERVQPARPFYARIACASHFCLGRVDNLSLTGIGILVYHLGDKPIQQELGHKVRVELQLKEDRQPIKLDAVIMSIHPIGRSLMQVGLQIIPTRRVMLELDQFIQLRKREIYNELNADWLSWREPRLTKDLYF
jgi:hypothetical protein